MPDLSGAAADAPDLLAAANLTGSSSDAFSDSVPAGDVISQDPAAGTSVDVGSSVSYVVSQGVEQTSVPDLSGAAADAPDLLAAANLTGSSSDAFSDSVPAGDVISQDPAAGTSVDVGSSVSYVVSQGVAPDVTVPPVRGLPEAEAATVIEDAGLTIGERVEQSHENVAAGAAIKTDPASDSDVPTGSAVTLYVSTGSALTSVPDVNDQPEADAIAAIEAAGLSVGDTKRPTNGGIPAGNAVKTEPAAGTELDLGTAVTLFVSSGPKQVVVPDVVGLLRGAANTAITDAELSTGEIDQRRGCGTQEHRPFPGSCRRYRAAQGLHGRLHHQLRPGSHERARRERPARG